MKMKPGFFEFILWLFIFALSRTYIIQNPKKINPKNP